MGDFDTAKLEDWQRDLTTFIAAVPQNGDKVRSGTPEWIHSEKHYSVADVAKLTDPKDYTENALFGTLTGRTHRDLLKQWVSNKTTSCNEFVTQCAAKMGWRGTGFKSMDGKALESGLGRFDIADALERWGMSNCWVPNDGVSRPEYGDLFRTLGEMKKDGIRENHMGVSLNFEGNSWNTVEGGQGGSSVGYDAVARRTRTWPVANLTGWVSMRAIRAAKKPVDYWMGGWWIVDEQLYGRSFYYFAAGDTVYYTSHRPASPVTPPDATATTGNYSRPGRHLRDLQIRWTSTDVDESWAIANDSDKGRDWTMVGKNAHGIKLSARRWVSADKDDPTVIASKLPR